MTLEGENLDKDGNPQPIKDIIFEDLTASQQNKNIINIKKKKDRLSSGNFLVKQPNGQILVDNLKSFRDYSLSLINDELLSKSISETMSYEVEKVDVGAKRIRSNMARA